MIQDQDPSSAFRAEQVERAAKLGEEHAEKERALQETLRGKRDEEKQKSKQATDHRVRDLEKTRNFTKTYRVKKSAIDKEIESEKEKQKQREENEEKRKQALLKEHRRQEQYFHSLRDMATYKASKEKFEQGKKQRGEDAYKKAEFERSMAIAAATQEELRAVQLIEREARAKKSVVNAEAAATLYKLNSEERMHLHDLENADHRERMAAESEKDPNVRQQKHVALDQQMRVKRRRIESDFSDKRQALACEDRRRRTAFDSEAQALRIDAARDRLHANAEAERAYSERLNQIGRERDSDRFGK